MASAPSSLTLTVPFLVNALLLFLSPFLGLAIQSRLRTLFSQWAGSTEGEQPLWTDPGTLARTSIWICDASQILATAVGPLVGLLLLRPNLGSAIALLYLASFVAAIAAFLGFTFLTQVDGYGHRRWRIRLFTPVVVGGIALNLIAAGVAALIGG